MVNTSIVEMEVFNHNGYVQHPLPPRRPRVQTGGKLGDKDRWFRPADSAVVMAEGESRNKTSYVLAYMQNCRLRVGDKLATQHGQKFTISQILDDDEMPTCYDEQTGESACLRMLVYSESDD